MSFSVKEHGESEIDFPQTQNLFNNDLVYRIVRREPILQRPILIRLHNHILVFLSVKIPEGTLLETRELNSIVDLIYPCQKCMLIKWIEVFITTPKNAFTYSLKPMLLYYFNQNINILHLIASCQKFLKTECVLCKDKRNNSQYIVYGKNQMVEFL